MLPEALAGSPAAGWRDSTLRYSRSCWTRPKATDHARVDRGLAWAGEG